MTGIPFVAMTTLLSSKANPNPVKDFASFSPRKIRAGIFFSVHLLFETIVPYSFFIFFALTRITSPPFPANHGAMSRAGRLPLIVNVKPGKNNRISF